MAKFKKKSNVTQEIPTSALPDIIFILLFFFMVTTKMRKTDPKVEVKIPQITQLQDLDETKEALDVYIGFPKDSETFGTEEVIQVNEKFIQPKDIHQVIAQTLAKMPIQRQSKNNIVVNIRVHEEANMGIVIDFKQELRKSSIRNIHFTSTKKKDEVI